MESFLLTVKFLGNASHFSIKLASADAGPQQTPVLLVRVEEICLGGALEITVSKPLFHASRCIFERMSKCGPISAFLLSGR